MSRIQVGATEVLLALEASLGTASEAVVETLAAIQARADSTIERVTEKRAHCRQQVQFWSDRISYADEEEDTSSYYRELEDWEARLDTAVRDLTQVENAYADFQRGARQWERLATEHTDKARSFLRRRVEEIEDYVALKADGGGMVGSSMLGGTAATASTSPIFATGYRRTKHDPRDWLWAKLYGPIPADLPERVNLESFAGPAYDQKKTPQCVCYSLSDLKHHDEMHGGWKWLRFDPEPIYRQCKGRDGVPNEDGTTIRDALKVACKNGLLADDGRRYFIKGYARLENPDEICHALSSRKVVLLGLQVAGSALSDLGRQAVVPLPDATDGGHCMLVVGYDATQRLFRVRNSWGTDWADTGHCWVPYGYLFADPDFDAWTTVCEKVSVEPGNQREAGPALPNREVFPSSNFAWFDPSDAILEGDDGPALEWARIDQDTARRTLETVTRMRPHLDLGRLKANNSPAIREEIARATDLSGRRAFSEDDLAVFDLFFGSDAMRIDSDGKGGFMVINGRHRLYQAQQLGLPSVPVSISNLARKQLSERIASNT